MNATARIVDDRDTVGESVEITLSFTVTELRQLREDALLNRARESVRHYLATAKGYAESGMSA
jgi:hypothetical protein